MSLDVHTLAIIKATEIVAELRRLNRWSAEPLPAEKFKNMGAFGINTMAFEQWLQFILIPRIHAIVELKGDFPRGSMLASYANRVFDGDSEVGVLHDLLYEVDKLINGIKIQPKHVEDNPLSHTITYGDTEIPPVVLTLIEVLPQFEGDDLESQLQTYDIFLSTLSPLVRPVISNLLQEAAQKTSNETSKVRILEAARSVASGGLAGSAQS